ncbi:extracellular solute-binding protein [Microbacterium tumbae]
MIRKRLTVAVVTAAALFALAGCAPSSQNSDGSASGGTVTYAGYGGTGEDAENAAWFMPFAEESGIEVVTDDSTSWAKVQEMVDAGAVVWDVVQGATTQGVEDNEYLEDIDCDVVDCAAFDDAYFPAYKQAVPLFVFSFVLAYNTDSFSGADVPASMSDFFDPSIEASRVLPMTASAWSGVLEAALLYDGVSRDDLYPLDVDRALSVLDGIKDQTEVLASDSECADRVSSGEAELGICYNGRVAIAADEGNPIDAVWGQQIEMADYIFIPKGAPNLEAAQKLVAYIVDNQGAIASEIAYSPINPKAPVSSDAKWADWIPSAHEGTGDQAPIVLDMDWWTANTESVMEKITAWISE